MGLKDRGFLPYYLALVAFAVSVGAISPLMSTMTGDLGIPPWVLGAAVSLQFAFFAASAFLGERLRALFRLGSRGMVMLGLGVLSLSLSAATLLPGSILLFLAWTSLLGVAGGLVETYASIGLSGSAGVLSFKPLCLSQVFYSCGGFVAPLVARLCLDLAGGWKPAFLVFGAIGGVACLVLALSSIRPDSGESARDTLPVSGPSEPLSERTGEQGRGGGFPLTAGFGILILCYVLVETLAWTWMPYMLETGRGLSAAQAASASGIFWVGMILGRSGALLLPERRAPILLLRAAPLLMLLAALLLPVAPPPLALLLLGAGAGPFWPLAVKVASDLLLSPGATAMVIGMGGIGAALGPLAGSLLVRSGIGAGYFSLLAATCIALAFLTFLILARSHHVRLGATGRNAEPRDRGCGFRITTKPEIEGDPNV